MSRQQKQTPHHSAWQTFAQAFTNWQANPVSRRRFVQSMGALSAGLFLSSASAATLKRETNPVSNKAPWPTIDGDERAFILNGPNWLNELANSEHGKAFVQLTTVQQEQLLQRIAQSQAGENWLSLLLLYIFEALLSSPIYGGNPNGIGWRWLEHNPGFPQPTINTSYKKLSQR